MYSTQFTSREQTALDMKALTVHQSQATEEARPRAANCALVPSSGWGQPDAGLPAGQQTLKDPCPLPYHRYHAALLHCRGLDTHGR